MVRTLALFILLTTLASGCDDSRPARHAEPAPAPPSATTPDKPDQPDAIDAALKAGPREPGRWLDDRAAFRGPNGAAKPPAQTVYRGADERPVHNDRRLAALGIHRYESRHLRLYTDIAPEIARTLPPLADLLYAELERYFGPLPPARDGSHFQMTGYVMKDQALFRQTGLLPENLPAFRHGRHRGQEFWMNDQEETYYRQHLLLHEATHCFMGVERDNGSPPPPWYMEGMAEHFAAHRTEADGRITFRVMPDGEHDFEGFRRIDVVRDEIDAGRFRHVAAVLALQSNDFLENPAYAWSWSLCHWLDKHPRHHDRFRALAECVTNREFAREFIRLFGGDEELVIGWAQFAGTLCDGYDVARAAIDFDAEPTMLTGPATTTIQADCGWQSTGWQVRRGQKYIVTATGQVNLAQQPKPWHSKPAGITFDYAGGEPIGRLLGALRESESGLQAPADGLLGVLPFGERHEFTAPSDGVLFLRVNDNWSRLADNTSHFTVTITPK